MIPDAKAFVEYAETNQPFTFRVEELIEFDEIKRVSEDKDAHPLYAFVALSHFSKIEEYSSEHLAVYNQIVEVAVDHAIRQEGDLLGQLIGSELRRFSQETSKGMALLVNVLDYVYLRRKDVDFRKLGVHVPALCAGLPDRIENVTSLLDNDAMNLLLDYTVIACNIVEEILGACYDSEDPEFVVQFQGAVQIVRYLDELLCSGGFMPGETREIVSAGIIVCGLVTPKRLHHVLHALSTGTIHITVTDLLDVYDRAFGTFTRLRLPGLDTLVFRVFCYNTESQLLEEARFVGILARCLNSLSDGARHRVTSRIHGMIEGREGDGESALRGPFAMLCTRLRTGYISQMVSFLPRGCPEQLAVLFANNEVRDPLAPFLERNDGFIREFYTHLFRMSSDVYYVMDFLSFFIREKRLFFAPVLECLPRLPATRECRLKLFEVFCFLIENYTARKGLEFFLRRTPALVGVVSHLPAMGPGPETTESHLFSTERLRFLVGRGLRRELVVFAIIVFHTETRKLHNYNYTGILEYIQDIECVSYLGDSLDALILECHAKIRSEGDFLPRYARSLLEIAARPGMYRRTCRICLGVLEMLFAACVDMAYDYSLHVAFARVFSADPGLDEPLLADYAKLYRSMLAILAVDAPYMHNYIVLVLCDLRRFGSLFNPLGYRDVAHMYADTQAIMDRIRKYPLGSPTEDERIDWLVDCAFSRRSEQRTLVSILGTVLGRIRAAPTLDGLYTLLKVTSSARYLLNETNDWDDGYSEHTVFTSQAERAATMRMELFCPAVALSPLLVGDCNNHLLAFVRKGIDFAHDPELLSRVARLTGGFIRWALVATGAILTGDDLAFEPFPRDSPCFPHLPRDFLVYAHNTYKKTTLFNSIPDKVFTHWSYVFEIDKLSVLDCVTVLLRSTDEAFITRASELLADGFPPKDVIFFVPQLVQCLRRAQLLDRVVGVLCALSAEPKVCHQVLWNLSANIPPGAPKDSCFRVAYTRITEAHPGHQSSVFVFFGEFCQLSSEMMAHKTLDKKIRNRKLNELISRIPARKDVYLPFSPADTVEGVVPDSGSVLTSYAKVPFLCTFKARSPTGEALLARVIFKAGDDCRQDMLALQVIAQIQAIFARAHFSGFLFPYRVIATGPGSGIIECIPNAVTRDQIGHEKINNLARYFELKFGFRESREYIGAVRNFAQSYAAYSLVSYFLNVRDRHNGNLMIDDKGHLIHIDFGFILEISPGNWNIEAPIKCTREIVALLDSADLREYFFDTVVKGFMLLRRNSKDLIMLLDSFQESGLACFTPDAIGNFVARFKFDLSDRDAKRHIYDLSKDCVQKMSTWMYDKYQQVTNNIAF